MGRTYRGVDKKQRKELRKFRDKRQEKRNSFYEEKKKNDKKERDYDEFDED